MATADFNESAEDLLQITFDAIDQGITIYDNEFRLIAWNRRYEEMNVFPRELCRKGLVLTDAYKVIAELGLFGDEDPEKLAEEHIQALKVGQIKEKEELEIPDGRTIEIRRYLLPKGGIAAVFSDITERKEFNQRLHKLAHYCSLTQLPNRLGLRKSATRWIQRAEQNELSFALLFVDLDGFKKINDTQGHIVGDQLLAAVADRFRMTLKGDGVVARFGGDEFCILTRRYRHTEAAINAAQDVAQRLVQSMQGSFAIDDLFLTITASVGVSMFPSDGKTFRDLLLKADISLHESKSRGASAITRYHDSMGEKVHKRARIESKIRMALNENNFNVVFQPRINLTNGTVNGLEALARLPNNTEAIGPATFVPIAEQSGMIGQLGTQILEHTANYINQWHANGLNPGVIAVNISPVQFRDPNLVGHLLQVLDRHRIAPQNLELEITETALMADREFSFHVLRKLRSEGFSVALDDFGVGYSSLDYLIDMPIDRLKIDRAFIASMHESNRLKKIVGLVVQLGKDLDLQVTAEGVETHEQAEILRGIGCDEIQGFLCSPPVEAKDVPGIFQQNYMDHFSDKD